MLETILGYGEEKISELYLWAYSRQPDEKELALAKGHIEKLTKDKKDKELASARRQSYEDLVWAMINTKEFLFNH